MPYTIETAFDEKPVENPRKLLSEFKFNLSGIDTEITVRIFKNIINETVFFEQSHYIHSPVQIEPYHTNSNWGENEAYVLHRAIESLTDFYNNAINAGHKPNESWLVQNDSF
ncbi:hypothetical protein JXQ31_02440 [candidate division KSB1 bacterium]|nr:hypothetical protein [candidate division KSB1 bacterium]